jgi:hypothetical protein
VPAPRSSPLIVGDRLITASAGGLMNAFDRGPARAMWTHDLVADTPDAVRACGYSSSPLAYKDRIITTVGGSRRGRRVARGSHGPCRVAGAGLRQRVLLACAHRPRRQAGGRGLHFGDVADSTPTPGALEWRYPHPADFGVNVAMPVWGTDHLLFVSSAYNGGSRALQLTRNGGGLGRGTLGE